MTLDPKPSTLDSVDPTRLSVSDDGRAVYLRDEHENRAKALLRLDREGKLEEGSAAAELENLPYRIYCEEALRAHGSDFSFIDPKCQHPFVGRVMLWKEYDIDTSVKVLLLSDSGHAECWVYDDEETTCVSVKNLHPLPPPTPPKQRRPMTPAEFVAALPTDLTIERNGEKWLAVAVDLCQKSVALELRGKGLPRRISRTMHELAAEGWRCGGQLLSVEE